MASDKVIQLTADNFESEIANYNGVALVDLWAEWCGPCKRIGPVIDDIAGEYEGKAKIAKINVDENQSLAAQFGVTSIPTILIFKNGEIADKIIGAVPKNILTDAIDKALG